MTLKLGKLPARDNAVQLKLASYVATSDLPTPPTSFGWDYLIKSAAWGMLANDTVGDCVIAGGLHETLLWRKTAKLATPLSTTAAIKNYELITGYDPNATEPDGSNPTDQGTDMEVAAKYRRKTGLVDADGHRHKIAAYVALEPGNIDQLAAATWIFGAVGMGIEFPAFAMDDFDAGKVWDVQKANAKIQGGHYIPIVGRSDDGNFRGVTWGRGGVEITPRFITKYCDEVTVCLSTEMLTNGVALNDFNLTQLRDDLKQVTSA